MKVIEWLDESAATPTPDVTRLVEAQQDMTMKLREMQMEIDKHMDKFDQQERMRISQTMEDLRKIIITA